MAPCPEGPHIARGMKKNLGDADRTLRLVIGASVGVVMVRHGAGSPALIISGLVAAYLLATTWVGWDLFYWLLRISTASATDAPTRKS